MPDYSKCIIYTIRTPTGLYVGSTCNFTNRKYHHNSSIHNDKAHSFNFKLYKNIRENNDEWEMKPYSVFPCKNKMEMNVEEERIRRELNADLNSYSCYGFNSVEYHKQYKQKNKEKFDERRELNREKVKIYNREYMRKYREKKKAEQIN